MQTRTDAITYLTTAIENGGAVQDAAAEYDLDAIASDLYDAAGSWDFDIVPADTFWSTVATHAKEA